MLVNNFSSCLLFCSDYKFYCKIGDVQMLILDMGYLCKSAVFLTMAKKVLWFLVATFFEDTFCLRTCLASKPIIRILKNCSLVSLK
jgi:hypothetical protein